MRRQFAVWTRKRSAGPRREESSVIGKSSTRRSDGKSQREGWERRADSNPVFGTIRITKGKLALRQVPFFRPMGPIWVPRGKHRGIN